MYEDDIFPPDQEGIFKGEVACLQAINLTTSTTEDDVFMGVNWSFLYGGVLDTWNTLLLNDVLVLVLFSSFVKLEDVRGWPAMHKIEIISSIWARLIKCEKSDQHLTMQTMINDSTYLVLSD